MATNLEQNTAGLEEILAAVNNLPEAGSGGGSVETCTITINFAYLQGGVAGGSAKRYIPNVNCIAYTDEGGLGVVLSYTAKTSTTQPDDVTKEIKVQKNTLFVIGRNQTIAEVPDGITFVGTDTTSALDCFIATSDATLNYM